MGVVMSIGADPPARWTRTPRKLHELGYAQELRRTDERVLELRRFLHHHLDPLRVPDGLRHRHDQRWARRHDLGLDRGRIDDARGRAGDGRGVLGVSDRGRPLLLVGQARQAQRRRLELVHRMVQPARSGSSHRRHRLRVLALLQCLSQPDHRVGGHPGPHPASSTRASSSSTPRSTSSASESWPSSPTSACGGTSSASC